MKGLNLSGFKKIKEDGKSATMIHKDGHQIVVAKTSLKPIQLKQLEKLPIHMKDGGFTPDDQPQPGWVQNPDPLAAALGGPAVIRDPRQQTQAPQSFAVDYNPDPASGAQFSTPQAAPADPVGNAQPAPQQQAQAQQPIGPDINKGLQSQINANDQMAKAEGNKGAQKASAFGDVDKQLANLPTTAEITRKYEDRDQLFRDHLQSKDIDPNHFWADKTTGQKVAAGIGLFLGGFSTPFTGQGNPALGIINNAIERDIDAQKTNLGKAKTLWSMNREAMHDDLAANLATRNQAYVGLQHTIAKIAATNQSPIAQARAAQLNAVIQNEMAQNNYKRSLMSGPTADSADPSARVNILVPPPERAKVFGEIEAAQNAVHHGPAILKAFDDAANKLHAVDFVPGLENVDQKAFHTLLGPTFKDVEGTVRQAAMDNVFHNTTPQFGDDKNTIATKRASIEQYLLSKSAAPTAKGNGIDLSKFPSTNIRGSLNNAQQPVKGADGKMYVRQGNFMVPVK